MNDQTTHTERKEIFDNNDYIIEQQGKILITSFFIFVTGFFYVLSIVAANMSIKSEYDGNKLDLPWFIPEHVLLRHGDQSYTTSVMFWSFILSIILMMLVNKLMKQILVKSIYTGKHYKLIGGIGLALKALILPLIVISTYRVGYQSSVILGMDYKHFIYAITSVFGFLGNFSWIIIIGLMFLIGNTFLVQPMDQDTKENLQQLKRDRMNNQMVHEIYKMRKRQ